MQLKLTRILPYVAYIYMAVICVFWWVDNFSAGYFNWFIFCLAVMNLGALLVRKKTIDIFLGALMSLGSAYMLMAVLSAYGRSKAKGFDT